LRNPTNDVREVVAVLRSAQFEVIYGRDLTRIQFEELAKTFLRSVENADVSLVYYSGHGVQIAGHNYLIPVDARLST
ncbi:caspase family protein, partial [Stenotrophomonas maltophilia]